MNNYRTLNHSKWDCKYHVVFIPKVSVRWSAGATSARQDPGALAAAASVRGRIGGLLRRPPVSPCGGEQAGGTRRANSARRLSQDIGCECRSIVNTRVGARDRGLARVVGPPDKLSESRRAALPKCSQGFRTVAMARCYDLRRALRARRRRDARVSRRSAMKYPHASSPTATPAVRRMSPLQPRAV